MLVDSQIESLMRQVAAGIFPARHLLEVRSEPTFDEEGQEALRITLVLTDEVANTLTGEQLTDLLMDIHDSLQGEGDERFPMLHYETPTDNGLGEDE